MKNWLMRFFKEFWFLTKTLGWVGLTWILICYASMYWVVGYHTPPELAHELRRFIFIAYPLSALFILSLIAAINISIKDD